MSPQLRRSETNRVIAGVGGGVAERFAVNSTLVRLAWVVSAFFGGFGVLLYLILWVALPTSPAHTRDANRRAALHARRDLRRGARAAPERPSGSAMTAILFAPMGWAGVALVGFAGIAVWILVIAVIMLVVRGMRTTGRDAGGPAVRLLEERYARSEITREEFLERRAVLDQRSPDAASGPSR